VNIFVAGIHGVGKTYLASRLPEGIGLLHTSASKLIREERAMPTWGADKRVNDIDANQVALAAAVRRHNDAGVSLLLDGHFVLLDPQDGFVRLESDVFKALTLRAVLLVEAAPIIVASRLKIRDGEERSTAWVEAFLEEERRQAQVVCEALSIPLFTLTSPDQATFTSALMSAL
jgi:adenylate kinase